MSNKILNLDLSKDPIMPAIVYGRVGDDRLQTVTVNLARRDEVADLTGYNITFEGTTYNGKTKVFDSDNVSSAAAGLKKGTFDYTFPNMAFAVAGKYEQAYFSIVKDGKRDTTANFEIYVDGNADIDAPEAETIVTEYNKLVEELHRLQKQFTDNLKKEQDDYIKDLVASLASINTQISDLKSKITSYETSVNKTATDAQKAINTTASSANTTISDALTETLETIKEALEAFQDGNFYTKPESDERFAKKSDLTKENVQLGNVDNYKTANQTDAEQGLALNKFITPMGVKQHVDARMATQEEAEAGADETTVMNPKRTKEAIVNSTPIEVYLNHTSSIPELDDVMSGIKFPIGDIQAIDPFHTPDDLPFTLSSDKTTLTMKRDATLLIQQQQEGRGNPSASYTDFFYFYFNGGATRYDGFKYGIDGGDTGINLSHAGVAQCVMKLKAGDAIWTSVSTRSTDRKLWKGSVRGTYIKELVSV